MLCTLFYLTKFLYHAAHFFSTVISIGIPKPIFVFGPISISQKTSFLYLIFLHFIPEAFTNPINYYRASVQYPVEPVNGKLSVPVFSIFGTADKYLSVAANKRSRDYCLDYEEQYFEGVSHWIMTEEPDLVNKAMEKYLKGRKSTRL